MGQVSYHKLFEEKNLPFPGEGRKQKFKSPSPRIPGDFGLIISWPINWSKSRHQCTVLLNYPPSQLSSLMNPPPPNCLWVAGRLANCLCRDQEAERGKFLNYILKRKTWDRPGRLGTFFDVNWVMYAYIEIKSLIISYTGCPKKHG